MFRASALFKRSLRGVGSAQASSFTGLKDLKVLDLTRIVAGPYCTMILGDLGAEIYKVEAPGSGDECRNWPPNVGPPEDRLSCYFASLNRNKKSICVNLKSTRGREVVLDMARRCDVLVENYVPGKLDALGLGYDAVREAAPRLVYCSITGYGREGRYRERPGYDVIAASVGGLVGVTGSEGGAPCKPGVAVTDLATGLYAHGAVLAALLERTATGEGQRVECDLLSTQLASLVNIGSNYLNAGREGVRRGTAHESIVPYQAFATADGYLTVGAGSDAQFLDLCSRLGLPEVGEDPAYRSNALRVENREPLLSLLEERFGEKTSEEWATLFSGAAFPHGPVNTLRQVFADPHVRDTGLVEEVKTPRGSPLRLVGPPVRYSSTENRVRSPPPLLGQHTSQVLASLLGYDANTIDDLYAGGHVQ